MTRENKVEEKAFMSVLYCRIGWMESYRGVTETDSIKGGGSYNKEHIGHEAYNFLGDSSRYYGYVQPSGRGSIHIERLGADKNADSISGITVIWVATKASGGQYIVGWYKNATVYRNTQKVPENVMFSRESKEHDLYNVYSEDVTLLNFDSRNMSVSGMGQSNVWFGNEELNARIEQKILENDRIDDIEIQQIEDTKTELSGEERQAVTKIRVNQQKFRQGLIDHNQRCYLCGIANNDLLIASHIKPWSVCDKHEKLDRDNGFLLCPNHDKLFDMGYISFDDNGQIMISNRLSEYDRLYMNVNSKMKITLTPGNRSYLQYHRKYIFR